MGHHQKENKTFPAPQLNSKIQNLLSHALGSFKIYKTPQKISLKSNFLKILNQLSLSPENFKRKQTLIRPKNKNQLK